MAQDARCAPTAADAAAERVPPPAVLPATLAGAVRVELRRAVRPTYEAPGVVLVNGALMTACWTLLPASVVGVVFRVHGPLAFAMVLACWMYADVPATNLLGADPARSLAALPDPAALRRLWYARNIVLWLSVTPLCALVAVAIGVDEHRPVTTALTLAWIATVPLGALGFAGWVGVWFPYHRLPLRHRWAARRNWRPMLLRWIVLLLVPYGVVPVLTVVVILPGLLLWLAVAAGDGRISDAHAAAGLALAVAVAAVAWPFGHRYGSRLAVRRRDRLAAFLSDPDRG